MASRQATPQDQGADYAVRLESFPSTLQGAAAVVGAFLSDARAAFDEGYGQNCPGPAWRAALAWVHGYEYCLDQLARLELAAAWNPRSVIAIPGSPPARVQRLPAYYYVFASQRHQLESRIPGCRRLEVPPPGSLPAPPTHYLHKHRPSPAMAEIMGRDPDVFEGRLCYAGTRVRVATVCDLMAEGESDADIQATFPRLDARQVKFTRAFLAEVQAIVDEHD